MEDNRVRVSTAKVINLAQLDTETGGHGLCGAEGEVVACEASPLTEAQLTAAIKAHTAVMPPTPEHVAQNATDAIAHAKSLGFTDAMISAMYPGLATS
jgi:uncharacterized membrane protein YdbT with pleckstrin-like domain